MSAASWVEAARPRTLPAAVAPVVVGTAAAEQFIAWRFGAALVVALAVQVAVNYANDYFDGVRGVDTAERTGPRRAVASGLIAPDAMRRGIAAALLVAAVAGAALAAAAGWQLLLVGLAAFAAALGYSGGPRPYASRGLGELFVFVFFGLVATIGSQYVHDEQISVVSAAASVPIGLLAVAILVVNNLRDVPTDRAAGKITMAVRLGEEGTRRYYALLLTLAFGTILLVSSVTESGWPALTFASLPLAFLAARPVVTRATGRELIPSLVATGRLELVFGLLLAAGLVLAA